MGGSRRVQGKRKAWRGRASHACEYGKLNLDRRRAACNGLIELYLTCDKLASVGAPRQVPSRLGHRFLHGHGDRPREAQFLQRGRAVVFRHGG